MKIGVICPQTESQGDPQAVHHIGLATEELGYDHLLTYDHGAKFCDYRSALRIYEKCRDCPAEGRVCVEHAARAAGWLRV